MINFVLNIISVLLVLSYGVFLVIKNKDFVHGVTLICLANLMAHTNTTQDEDK